MLAKAPNKKAAPAPTKILPPADGKPFQLDIGCGQNKQADHFGIDIAACPGVDYVMDVRKTPWPIDDGVVDQIFTSHFFEHLDGEERFKFMDECWRVLRPAGQVIVVCPYWSSMRAYGDPVHKFPPVCEWTFYYYNEGWRQDNKLTHYPIKCNFDWSPGHAIDPELAARSDDYRQFAMKHYLNTVMDIHITLTKWELGIRTDRRGR